MCDSCKQSATNYTFAMPLYFHLTQPLTICKTPVDIVKGKGKVHLCTGTEALYRQYGPQGE
jgi:hypothetical protein